ncbi:peptide ABC transporter substrate-binding protein [Virgibacillus halodenitrificans]|uniref:Peptide ABC transporter substrate-binding protein n=1 Tax=Virgibacillus halodenitrificans TaxID=1482 RepID=A0ABR7VL49_VIRHA|nr:peptide ABC transporter substrate-binding protein [Virgibacillus halodenitrificans]MBD1221134.1 peptide ABC transporter substrate-binding protein [Virgibacillus halodenitrificans]MCG1027231.1 peptide ABC transporter substrate-binding protein [Virgibacillus halodenitrificans]MYL57366.1 peptide ABC transporter substrate-binding protein [Virgibacillus halodenitrificans]
MVKKRIAILFILVALMMAACSENENKSEAEGSKGQELVLNAGSEPASLDPAMNTSVTSGWILDHMYEGLYTRDQNGDIQLGIAEDVDVSDDGTVYTFSIKENAKWSDGTDVTAEDFKYSWERVLNPNTGARFAYYLFVIKNAEAYNKGEADIEDVGIEVINDKTLEVTLESPTAFLDSLMTIWTFYPVKKDIVEKDENWTLDAENFVTNGAFYMTDWEHDNKIVLTKNDNYYSKEEVNLNKITFEMVDDATTAYQLYQTGDLDFISAIPTDQLAAVKDSDEYNEFPYYSTAMYIFNVNKEPFTNQKVRQAFSMAVDRKSLVENVGQTGEAPAFAMVPPGADTPDGDFREVGGDYFKEDNTKAKALIAEAMDEEGWSEFPEVTLMFSTSDNNKRYAEAVQEMVKQNLNIDLKLANQEWNTYLDTLGRGDYQMGRMSWTGLYIDPAVNLEYYLGTSTNNRTGWVNKEYDQLLKDAQVEQDITKRYELLHDAEEILMTDAPFMPLYFLTNNYLTSSKVDHVAFYENRRPVFKWASIKENE